MRRWWLILLAVLDIRDLVRVEIKYRDNLIQPLTDPPSITSDKYTNREICRLGLVIAILNIALKYYLLVSLLVSSRKY